MRTPACGISLSTIQRHCVERVPGGSASACDGHLSRRMCAWACDLSPSVYTCNEVHGGNGCVANPAELSFSDMHESGARKAVGCGGQVFESMSRITRSKGTAVDGTAAAVVGVDMACTPAGRADPSIDTVAFVVGNGATDADAEAEADEVASGADGICLGISFGPAIGILEIGICMGDVIEPGVWTDIISAVCVCD